MKKTKDDSPWKKIKKTKFNFELQTAVDFRVALKVNFKD